MLFRVGRRTAGPSGSTCHDPQLMASVQENRSKDIPVVSLLIGILSAVIHRVASDSLVPLVWGRGFSKVSSCRCRQLFSGKETLFQSACSYDFVGGQSGKGHVH